MNLFRKLACRLPHINWHEAAIDISQAALIVMDVQNWYANPDHQSKKGTRGNKHTARIAHRIGETVKEFRARGMAVYAIRTNEGGDYYGFQPAPSDFEITKHFDSAVRRTELLQMMKSNGHRDGFICGFNLNACITQTALDMAPQAGFRTSLLRDLCGNDSDNDPRWASHYIMEMKESGIIMAHSRVVLNQCPPKVLQSASAPASHLKF